MAKSDDDLEDVLGEAGFTGGGNSSAVAAGQLKAIVERIEKLEEERQVVASDIKEVYAEAKGNGFDAKVIRKVIALRKRPKGERDEEAAILDLYLSALGMA